MIRLLHLCLFVIVFPLFLVSCANVPPITPRGKMCGFASYDLAVESTGAFGDESSGRSTLSGKLNDALAIPLADATEPSPSLLFLSGGSLHGAFGAGFLAGWKHESGGRLPDFKVVTGISTGAILATFAFIDQPERAVEGYTIRRKSDLLNPFGKISDGKPTLSAYVKLLQKGALADLSPLRERLRGYIDDATLRKVAMEGARGRLLLIGVVDVDTGQAVVLDLTDMAEKYTKASDDDTRTLLRDCYVEGIVASSSAPLAALPVFIDNRMYVDGGVRFGMFSDEIGDRINPTLADAAKPTIYLLINGDQETKSRCGKAAGCPADRIPPDPAGNYAGAHAKWSFPDLALRSEGILANQVYRFSQYAIEQGAQQRKYAYRPIKIEANMPEHAYPRGTDGKPTADARSCADWKVIDAADGKAERREPLQFFPKYMQCVIDYGRARVPQVLADWKARVEEKGTTNPFPANPFG